MICENLLTLRRLHKLTQEEIAGRLGVSRQAVAKWESGETTPDIANCQALAAIYEVTLDDLVNYSQSESKLPLPPRGKHLFGTVTMGDKGQIVIPKQARAVFGLHAGDQLVVLGDETQGLALIRASDLLELLHKVERGAES